VHEAGNARPHDKSAQKPGSRTFSCVVATARGLVRVSTLLEDDPKLTEALGPRASGSNTAQSTSLSRSRAQCSHYA